ncbi:MAG: response regulator transcription factor [Bacillota bacterium]|nr:response regulator transcription factor [Bacillota bacterium]
MPKIKGIRVMLVDDEPSILQFLELGLKNEGFEVRSALDGQTAITIASEFQPHIVVLDIMMPGMNGFEVCRMLKERDSMSVIMLTAKDEIEDKVKGLNCGADDYMVKPFSFDELLARIKARIRNQHPSFLEKIEVGPLFVDNSRKEIRFKGKLLELSPTEYNLLRLLIQNHGIVLSKSMILDKIWGYDFNGDDNIVEVYIRSLRAKLKDKERKTIKTLRGLGYMIDLDNAD